MRLRVLARMASLALVHCDARSYDASCAGNQTGTSVEGSSCTASALGDVACALPAADTCTPLSSTVVACREADGGQSWKSVSTCPSGQTCYFFQPPVSNAIGCGVLDYPMTEEGATCDADGSAACSFDGAEVLRCTAGTWTKSASCAKPQACGGVACDASGPYCVGCE